MSHPPLGHDAVDWGLSVIHFPCGKYQQQWDQMRFNDGGARFSAELVEDLENMCIVSVVPRIDPRARLIELNASTYSSNLEKRWASYPSAFYSIVVSNSGFGPISCPNMTNVSQDGVSEGELNTHIAQELNLIRSLSPSFVPLPSCSRS